MCRIKLDNRDFSNSCKIFLQFKFQMIQQNSSFINPIHLYFTTKIEGG